MTAGRFLPQVNGHGVPDLDVEAARVFDSYLSEVQSGLPSDPERLLAANPHLADRLRACLEVMNWADRLAGGSEVSSGLLLGDFRVIREIGRGGMGMVYEAVQVSLGRRVALKVLPFAATLDPHQLSRFQTESQAAARLHHTNIVPVFAVGRDRGVHFYAMQFIEGHSLDATIRELRLIDGAGVAGRSTPPDGPTLITGTQIRSPLFIQTVVHLAIQAAEALDHAHTLGIVHRDVKPANLLVDVRGNLWVTDFGLARMQAGSGLTVTGDVIGTLRYMSPEQWLGGREVVDHRTDIYSLGATLYELMTLRPAHEARDHTELVQHASLRQPIFPRRLNRAVPRDLETIVMKAMARDVPQRYDSALDLADDLRRFLDHRPIAARRPRLWRRTAKWVRRHRLAVASVTSVLLFVSVACAVVFNQQRRNLQLEHAVRARRYAEDIHQASNLVHRCCLGEAGQILSRYLPGPGEEDLRTGPWFHLWRVCRYPSRTLRAPGDSGFGPVYHVEFSPNGDLLASSGQDGSVRLWDWETGRLERTLHARQGDVNWAAFSPDGTILATGGDDGAVRLWSPSEDSSPIILGKHDQWVTCVLFSPDGRRLVSCGREGRVKVWDLATRREVASVAAEGVLISPDGHTMATGVLAGEITLRDLETTRAQPGSLRHEGVMAGAFSHDGRLLATSGHDLTVKIWDVGRRRLVADCRGHEQRVQSVAFSPDDRSVASCGDDGVVRLWESATGDPLQAYRAEPGRLWSVAFSPDGRTLASSGADGVIRRWDLSLRQDRTVIRLPNFEAQSIAMPAVADRLVVAGRATGDDHRIVSVATWDLAQGVTLKVGKFPLKKPCHGSVLSRDGELLCTLEEDGGLTLWDIATGRASRIAPPARVPVLPPYLELSMSDEFVSYKYLIQSPYIRGTVVSDFGANRLHVFEDHRFSPLVRVPGHVDVVVCLDDELVRWNPVTGRVSSEGIPSGRGTEVSRLSHDGRTLAGAGGDGTVSLWDARTLRREMTLFEHRTWVHDIAFSPDDKVLASASEDGTVKLWDVAMRRELHTFLSDPDLQVDHPQLRFSPDGMYLVCLVKHSPRHEHEIIVWRVGRQTD